MPLPVSSISQMCRSISDFLKVELDAAANSVRVMIGHPAAAEPKKADNDHRVNLFFYSIEPSGLAEPAASDQPWFVRLNCLITAFGVAEQQGQVSSGENDLRLLGEVVRVFHETPILPAITVGSHTVRLRALFQPLGVEAINNLWGTQNGASYRPSAAYEFALGPVVPSEERVEGPLVGAIGAEGRATMEARTAAFGGVAAAPPFEGGTVDTTAADWAPLICFVHEGAAAQSLALPVASVGGYTPAVWVAGDTGATVTMQWSLWDKTAGWRPEGSAVPASPSSESIDPAAAATATTVTVPLPAITGTAQALLYATRDYTRGSEGATLEVRSNPLLITVYAGT